jgi:hypothetical protein
MVFRLDPTHTKHGKPPLPNAAEEPPSIPIHCGIEQRTLPGKHITILGVSHSKSGAMTSGEKESLFKWINTKIHTIQPNVVLLEMGMGMAKNSISPELYDSDRAAYNTHLRAILDNPDPSEMHLAVQTAHKANTSCMCFNAEPDQTTLLVLQNKDEWIGDLESRFTAHELITAQRSTAMLHFYLGHGKYEGDNTNDFLTYITKNDRNPAEKWVKTFEILHEVSPQFNSFIEQHKTQELNLLAAPSRYVEKPTVLNKISDAQCRAREAHCKQVTETHGGSNTLFLCGSGHLDDFSALFKDEPTRF